MRGGMPGYSVGGDTRVVVGGNLNAVASQTLQNGTAGVTCERHQLREPARDGGQNGFDPAHVRAVAVRRRRPTAS